MLVIIGRPFSEKLSLASTRSVGAQTRLKVMPRGNTSGLRPAAGGSGTPNEGNMGTPTHLSTALSLTSSEAEAEASGFPDCRGEWQDLEPTAEIEPC